MKVKNFVRAGNAKASGSSEEYFRRIYICPQCGFETFHLPGEPCIEVVCKRCGSPMNRKML